MAVIGDFAVEPRYQGAGSSMVNPIQVETMERVIGDSQLSVVGISRGYERNGDPDDILKKEAVDLAEKAEVVIYSTIPFTISMLTMPPVIFAIPRKGIL
ncbi:hypothetical protein [Hungatella hathewayi]|uniref:hypothetical protein n=1 Tax=Hungatella hathewayi TaxID=154046 RepID=UPI0035619FDD